MARKYQAVLPISVQVGHILLVRADDRSVRVRFPKKLKAGSVFYFVIPNNSSNSNNSNNNSNNDDETSNSSSNSKSNKQAAAAAAAAPSDEAAIYDASTEGPSAIRDWVVSIGLGLVVSVSIIFGFLTGVLYVTEPLNSLHQQQMQPPPLGVGGGGGEGLLNGAGQVRIE
jgi:hypothetical protein